MSASTRLTKAFERALENPIRFNNQDKFIIFSDTHRGTNDWGDDFAHNQLLFFHALMSYYEDGFTYIENGDGDELSENWRFSKIRRAHSHVFWLMQQFHKQNRLIMIYGNHDAMRQYPGVVRRSLHTYHDDRDGEEKPLFDGIHLPEGVVLEHEETGKETQRLGPIRMEPEDEQGEAPPEGPRLCKQGQDREGHSRVREDRR